MSDHFSQRPVLARDSRGAPPFDRTPERVADRGAEEASAKTGAKALILGWSKDGGRHRIRVPSLAKTSQR